MDDRTMKPTLTFDDIPEAPAAPGASSGRAAEEDAADAAELQKFTPEEQKQIDDFASQIDLTNSAQILNYGLSAQKRSVTFSDQALKCVRSKEFGEIGDLLTEMTVEIRNFDKEDKKGLAGFFQKKKTKAAVLRSRYSTTEENLNKVVDALEDHQFTLRKDINLLDKLYAENEVYFKELSMYIAAGKKKLEDVRQHDLPALQQQAASTGLPEDAQKVNDLNSMIDRFEKKIYDLELTRNISLQTAPQIRMIQADENVMAEKIQSTIVNTIPLWKNQMVLALGIEHASQAARAQKLVTDATNEMLRKNADTLKQASVQAAEANERSIVDVETLEHTNQTLLSTIDEVLRIQEEGRQRRKDAEERLTGIEQELKTKLLETGSRADQQQDRLQ